VTELTHSPRFSRLPLASRATPVSASASCDDNDRCSVLVATVSDWTVVALDAHPTLQHHAHLPPYSAACLIASAASPTVATVTLAAGHLKTTLQLLDANTSLSGTSPLDFSLDHVTSVSVAAATDDTDQCTGTMMAVTWTTLDQNVSLALLCLDETGRHTSLFSGRIDRGSLSHVSLINTSNGLVVAEVHTDGYCDNSHAHNTQATPRVCSAPRVPTKNVLVYNHGLVGDWVSWLKLGHGDVTSCNDALFHGAFGLGASPALTTQIDNEAVRLIVVHQGLGMHDEDQGACGMPLRTHGVVVDSWLA